MFEPEDWVWLHMRKERFPIQRRSKLQPRGDGPFQVLERINDNAYKLDLPGEYNVSATFNVSDLSPFDTGADSRSNPFQEGGDDVIMAARDEMQGQEDSANNTMDPIHIPVGPITRHRARKIKDAMAGLAQHHVAEINKSTRREISFNKEGPRVINLTQVKEDN